MRDQAAELRNLVLRAARQQRLDVGPLPRVAWMMGASPSMGVNTISISLAEWLAENGYRIVLINASEDVDTFCRLTNTSRPDRSWLKDRREIHEVLQSGSAGLQIVASLGGCMGDATAGDQRQWLLRQLGTLRPHADLVILKGGRPDANYAQSIGQWASEIIVVSTPDTRAVMNAYACLKAICQQIESPKASLLINRAESEDSAREVWARIARSSQQFLDFVPGMLGHLREDPALSVWTEASDPSSIELSAETSEGIRRLGINLLNETSDRIPSADAA